MRSGIPSPEGEAALLPVLLKWLSTTRRIRFDSRVVCELPWYGRRVDLATLTRSGVVTAYELKLRNTLRAIEQASFNEAAFDRSWVVTATRPTDRNVEVAIALGVGILLARGDRVTVVTYASAGGRDGHLRRRLITKIRTRSAGVTNV
jgi:hypothetical protein